MAPLETLDPQQRAVLALLLRQGKSYDEIAGLLKTNTSAIRQRAQGAVDALGADATELSPDRRSEIADYLLGQQTASRRAATREYLEASPDGRAWARAAAGELAEVAGAEKLPDVPAEREEVAQAFGALEARTARKEEVQRAAKRGNALVSAGLGLLLALVIIGVIALVSSGGDDTKGSDAVATTTATTATTPAADPEGDPQILAQGELRAPGDSTASGQVAIVRFPKSNRYRLALTAKGLPPSSSSGSAYAVWFYTAKDNSLFLGFPDKVVGSDGKLDTVADLSPDTPNYTEVLLTSERANTPKTPGTVVLRAKLVIARSAAAQSGGATTPPAQTTTP